MDSVEVDVLRRRFQALHSSLRDSGHNPLEAVSLLADTLAPNGHPRDARLSLELDEALRLVASDSTAGSVSVAFQQFIVSEARNGLGQYLTPLPVAELIADVTADAKPGSILDPFAGSGLLLDRVGDRLPRSRLLGIEINPAVGQVTRAVSRLAHHPIEVTDGDSFLIWTEGELPAVDAVVTNPPFGSIATRAARDGLRAAGAAEALLALAAIPAELLGLDLSVAALRPGGFLAIVLPQSVLTNAKWAGYRTDLFQRIRLHAVVSLPEETFGPFKGVAKASVLFAFKKPVELPVHFPYARSRSIGYDDTGRSTSPSDLPNVYESLVHRREAVPTATVDQLGRFHMPVPSISPLDHRQTVILGDIAEVFTGRTLGRTEYADSGPRLLKVGDLSGSFISWRPRKRSFVPPLVYERSTRARLRLGDVCLTSAAHKPRYIGLKVDLVDELPAEGAMASAEVLVIRVRDDAAVTPEQVLFHLRSQAGYEQLQDLVRGSTAHIYPRDVEGLVMPLPDPATFEPARVAFWKAAAAFREYLGHEAEAVRLGVTGAVSPSEDTDA